MKSNVLAFIFMAFTSIGSLLGQSTFDVTTTDAPAAMDDAIDYATDIWSTYLNSDVPIRVNITYVNLTNSGPLALCLPNGALNFDEAPVADVWFATSLANSLAGIDLSPGEADMDIFVNSSVNYYFGTDGNPGSGQYDFVSVIMHEVVHGFGGLSLGDYSSGSGSLGEISSSDFFPLTTSFPFPQLQGWPSIWDTFITNSDGEHITDQSVFINPSNALGSAFVSNNLYFSGSGATSGNSGIIPKIFAPASFQFGSSLHHFDESTFPLASGNSLFTPNIGATQVEHNPGPMLLGALADIGWSVNLNTQIPNNSGPILNVFPVPAGDQVNIVVPSENGVYTLQIFSVEGLLLRQREQLVGKTTCDLSNLPSGIIVLYVEGPNFQERRKVVHISSD